MIEQSWVNAVGVAPPEIHGHGVVPARIKISLSGMELTSEEARELADVLRHAADERERLDAEVGPHLQAAYDKLEEIRSGR